MIMEQTNSPVKSNLVTISKTCESHSRSNEFSNENMRASPSAGSYFSQDDDVKENPGIAKEEKQVDKSCSIISSIVAEPQFRNDAWLECFTTTKKAEYEALLFSVYVSERIEKKMDGWTYFDCLHRLQSKCRYRVRAKKQDEFYIIEEKCFHNHGTLEPIGQAGSHAGLPKAIRELVDKSFIDNWSAEERCSKVEKEIIRLGLPDNPRLGRQIDNRIAYLRRVKNLSESRKMQDQVTSHELSMLPVPESILDPSALQTLLHKNGGSLVVEQELVEQLIGTHVVAALASAQNNLSNHNAEN